MRLWEKLSTNIFRSLFSKQLVKFEGNSPEQILKKSLSLLGPETLPEIKSYITSRQHDSGGFMDKAGNPDLYYSLFGFFLANAFNMPEIKTGLTAYVRKEIGGRKQEGIYLYCSAIMAAGLPLDQETQGNLRREISRNLDKQLGRQPAYAAFITLLACYYTNDFTGILRVRKHLNRLSKNNELPSTVTAALIILRHTFGRNTSGLNEELSGFYDTGGGFKAVRKAPVADLLSTAVCLYAERFTGRDIRNIRPDCLNFVDSLYLNGGFGGNLLDPEPDIENTFYGLLALGSLAD